MSEFELNRETAIDVLIFDVIGADGHIEYDETQTVNEILSDLDYDPDNYYQKTLLFINGLSTKHTNALIERARDFVCKHYSRDRIKYILMLLENIAKTDGKVSKPEKEQLDALKTYFEENCV